MSSPCDCRIAIIADRTYETPIISFSNKVMCGLDISTVGFEFLVVEIFQLRKRHSWPVVTIPYTALSTGTPSLRFLFLPFWIIMQPNCEVRRKVIEYKK